MKKIVIATKNKGKVEEFRVLFHKYQMDVRSLLDYPEELASIEETGSTFEENAKIKAETISNILDTTVLADDSGLVIDALHGAPGVYSARYAGEASNDQDNIDKVMNEMQSVPIDERDARFICVIAVAAPGEKTFFRTGTCEGEIALTQSGLNGFGYDPIFIPKNYSKTMAELSREEKNRISHRTNALTQLASSFSSHF